MGGGHHSKILETMSTFTDKENVEPEFLQWWQDKEFSGYPWTEREVQLIALLAWRDSKYELKALCTRAADALEDQEPLGVTFNLIQDLRKVTE